MAHVRGWLCWWFYANFSCPIRLGGGLFWIAWWCLIFASWLQLWLKNYSPPSSCPKSQPTWRKSSSHSPRSASFSSTYPSLLLLPATSTPFGKRKPSCSSCLSFSSTASSLPTLSYNSTTKASRPSSCISSELSSCYWLSILSSNSNFFSP